MRGQIIKGFSWIFVMRWGSIDQIAAQFKNGSRNKTAIAENLDRLEWFSILICQEENHIKYWQHIEIP